MTRVTPKMRESPAATKNRPDAEARPSSAWKARPSQFIAERYQRPAGASSRLANVQSADAGAERGLMIAGAEMKRPERAVHLEAAKGVNELLSVGRGGLGDAGGNRLHGQIAHDRADPRV